MLSIHFCYIRVKDKNREIASFTELLNMIFPYVQQEGVKLFSHPLKLNFHIFVIYNDKQ